VWDKWRCIDVRMRSGFSCMPSLRTNILTFKMNHNTRNNWSDTPLHLYYIKYYVHKTIIHWHTCQQLQARVQWTARAFYLQNMKNSTFDLQKLTSTIYLTGLSICFIYLNRHNIEELESESNCTIVYEYEKNHISLISPSERTTKPEFT